MKITRMMPTTTPTIKPVLSFSLVSKLWEKRFDELIKLPVELK